MVTPDTPEHVPPALQLLDDAAERITSDEREWMIVEAERVSIRSAALASEGSWGPNE